MLCWGSMGVSSSGVHVYHMMMHLNVYHMMMHLNVYHMMMHLNAVTYSQTAATVCKSVAKATM